MQNIKELMVKVIHEDNLIYAVFSNLRNKSEKSFTKVTLKKVLIKNKVMYQFEYFYDQKVEHVNSISEDTILDMIYLTENVFKQVVINTVEADYQVLVSKKGKTKILKKAPTRKMEEISHNRKKNYLLQEGVLNTFLLELGIMNERGKINTSKYDKFKQINRYLELVSDVLPNLNSNKTIRIVDFGCGKAYLTFALYDYLVVQKGLNVEIVGLDLKEDVIEFCTNLAKKLEYHQLRFQQGDIKGFKEFDSVDMVISLHACDTATDDALVKAVKWGAKVILAVPCCQNELLNKIHCKMMEPMMKHGIIKEKLSTLITDSLRANVLEIMGYSTQIIEFIDMEHTPKNMMIRGIYEGKPVKESIITEYIDFKRTWHIRPYIEDAFGKDLVDKLH